MAKLVWELNDRRRREKRRPVARQWNCDVSGIHLRGVAGWRTYGIEISRKKSGKRGREEKGRRKSIKRGGGKEKVKNALKHPEHPTSRRTIGPCQKRSKQYVRGEKISSWSGMGEKDFLREILTMSAVWKGGMRGANAGGTVKTSPRKQKRLG